MAAHTRTPRRNVAQAELNDAGAARCNSQRLSGFDGVVAPLPWLDRLGEVFGPDVGDVAARRGADVEAQLDAWGAAAACVDGEVLLRTSSSFGDVAHEVAHALQGAGTTPRPGLSRGDDAAEREAEEASAAASRGERFEIREDRRATVHRKELAGGGTTAYEKANAVPEQGEAEAAGFKLISTTASTVEPGQPVTLRVQQVQDMLLAAGSQWSFGWGLHQSAQACTVDDPDGLGVLVSSIPHGPSSCWSFSAPAVGEYSVQVTPYLNGEPREAMTWRFEVTQGGLTHDHAALIDAADQSAVDGGTREWGTAQLAAWQAYGGEEYLFEFKKQWVAGYRETIQQAATRYDLPVRLLAGVAFAEVGGDPLWIDPLADGVRSLTGAQEAADKTSYGNVSIQVKRAAEALGYEPEGMSDEQRKAIVSSLQDPRQNILIAAAHLDDLRNVDYPGVSANDLDDEQVSVIATRYNRGAEVSLEDIRKNLSYGRALLSHADEIAPIFAEEK